jgi:penicillin-binding protein 1C
MIMNWLGGLWARRRRYLAAALLVVAPFALLTLYARLAPFDPPQSRMAVPGQVVLDASGSVLARDGSAGFRIPVTLDQVAPVAIEATVAAEDQRFRRHPGVDPLAIARALLTRRSNPSGASTITQQLARRLYLADAGGPALVRKARESLIALQLEAHGSKDSILEAYLNTVYYGRGAYGIEAAARVYFDTSAGNLDLAQAAMLAGLPQQPSAYDPGAHVQAAKGRQRYVLGRMRESGAISRVEEEEALAAPLPVLPELAPVVAPHFVAFALDELARVRPDLAGRPGLVIETTLDGGLQDEAERSVDRRLGELQDRDAGNAAVVALGPASGAIRVMVGSADFASEDGGQVNMALAPRQPGSALKPFLYAAAMERGFTAATPLLDVPSTFQAPEGPYSPGNYDRRFHGVVPLRVALASSYNVPAVRTLDTLGIDAFLEVAHRFGLSTLTDAETYGLALTLGGGEVRLLDLVAAYGAIANEGQLARPYAVTRVRDTTGRLLYEHRPDPPRAVLSPQLAYILSNILSDPEARIPGFGQASPLDLSFRAAAKTGTTTGWRDNWTLGFTPRLAAGAWVGNTDNRPMREVSGVDGAGPIWHDVMEAASAASDWPARPPGLVRATVCAPTGLLPGPDCPSPVEEWFVAGTQPEATESYYLRDEHGRLAVNPPPEARAWAVEAGVLVASTPVSADPAAAVRIVAPPPGSVLFLSPELPAQEVLLAASAPPGTTDLRFLVDGAAVGAASGAATAVWRLEPGAHVIEVHARLPGGQSVRAESRYEVRTR